MAIVHPQWVSPVGIVSLSKLTFFYHGIFLFCFLFLWSLVFGWNMDMILLIISLGFRYIFRFCFCINEKKVGFISSDKKNIFICKWALSVKYFSRSPPHHHDCDIHAFKCISCIQSLRNNDAKFHIPAIYFVIYNCTVQSTTSQIWLSENLKFWTEM